MHKRRSTEKAIPRRRSSTLKIQRQLLLLKLLVAEAHPAAVLIAQINAQLPGAYPAAAKAALRHDLRALRTTFKCQINYVHGRGFVLVDAGDFKLVQLDAHALRALRHLRSTVADTAPEREIITALVNQITAHLTAGQQALADAAEPVINLDGPRITYSDDQRTLQKLGQAKALRRWVTFRYRSNMRGMDETHQVAPVELFKRDGHTYLLGYCRQGPAAMVERVGGYVDYRVDYMLPASVELLPDRLPPQLPKRRQWQVVYELSPEVARNQHVAHWLPETQIEYRDDGSALVTAVTHNLWQARQTLLRYLDACRVLEPAELVAMMAATARDLLALYTSDRAR